MNWYKDRVKVAYVPGGMEPIMDKYDRGFRPPSSDHREQDFTKTKTHPFVSTNTRDGYDPHRNTSNLEPNDDKQDIKNLPHEDVLMYQDPPTGEGTRGNEFVPEEDILPIGDEISRRLDRRLPPIKRDVYKNIRRKSRFAPINKI